MAPSVENDPRQAFHPTGHLNTRKLKKKRMYHCTNDRSLRYMYGGGADPVKVPKRVPPFLEPPLKQLRPIDGMV